MTANEEPVSRLAALFCLVFGSIVGFAVGVAVGMSHGSGYSSTAQPQQDAEYWKAADTNNEVPAGHWVVNPQTGERVFVYGKEIGTP